MKTQDILNNAKTRFEELVKEKGRLDQDVKLLAAMIERLDALHDFYIESQSCIRSVRKCKQELSDMLGTWNELLDVTPE